MDSADAPSTGADMLGVPVDDGTGLGIPMDGAWDADIAGDGILELPPADGVACAAGLLPNDDMERAGAMADVSLLLLPFMDGAASGADLRSVMNCTIFLELILVERREHLFDLFHVWIFPFFSRITKMSIIRLFLSSIRKLDSVKWIQVIIKMHFENFSRKDFTRTVRVNQ